MNVTLTPCVATDGMTTVESGKSRPAMPGLLHGLTYQTPVIGTIRIGSVEDRDGEALPKADGQFTINTRYRDDAGEWVEHEAMNRLATNKDYLVNEKLRRIPVRIIYDNPNLNLGEQYAAFTKDGRPACVGNGEKAKQASLSGDIKEVNCPGPSLCAFGAESEHRCGAFARALFHIEGQDASEGAFIFRTGSYNSVNDLRVRLQSLYAGFGKKLSGLPMMLTMRLKSTAQSRNKAFFYVSLEPRFASFAEGLKAIKERAAEEETAGFDRAAYEASMALLLANGAFTENHEDMSECEDLIAGRNQSEKRGASSERSRGPSPDLADFLSQYSRPAANSSSTSAGLDSATATV